MEKKRQELLLGRQPSNINVPWCSVVSKKRFRKDIMRKIKMVSRCRLAGTIKRKKEKQEKDISAYHNDRKRLQKVWFYLDV